MKIALDTMIFIYHLEDYPQYSEMTETLFRHIELGRSVGVTSYITLLEILVRPKQERKFNIVAEYKELLLTFPNLTFIPTDLHIVDLASSLRAKYAIKTPDAIQTATAIAEKADVFITNDERLKKVVETSVIMLDEWTE